MCPWTQLRSPQRPALPEAPDARSGMRCVLDRRRFPHRHPPLFVPTAVGYVSTVAADVPTAVVICSRCCTRLFCESTVVQARGGLFFFWLKCP